MVVIEPPEADWARGTPIGMGAGRGIAFGRGGSGEPFLVLRGEEVPPPGIQAIDVWALVTLRGAPVAFISPDIVTALDPDQQVAKALFDDLTSAYVADFASQPRDFFRAQLQGEVVGPVFIFERRFAGEVGPRIAVTEFDETRCPRGNILPIGEHCRGCSCERGR